MGISNIVLENFKEIEKVYLLHGGSKSIEDYLSVVFSEIILKNNYDLILDENAKDVFKNRIGRDAIIIDTMKAAIDYYCSMLNLEILGDDDYDTKVANSIVTEAIISDGKLRVHDYINNHRKDINAICRIYISTIAGLDRTIRQDSVTSTSNILNQIIDRLNNRQKEAILDKSILYDNYEYHY